jgi:chromosome segregation ATPase
MPPEEAKRYVLAHMTDLKLLQQRLSEADTEAASWEARVKLAQAKGMADLEAEAAGRAAAAREKAASLRAEADALARDIERMREQIPGLEARVRSVDPDVLLAGLQMVTGEMEHPGEARLDAQVKATEADEALAALKASLGMAPPPPPPPSPEAGVSEAAAPSAQDPGPDEAEGAQTVIPMGPPPAEPGEGTGQA